MTTTDDFSPARRAIKIQGGALYLQVKDRLIWARRDHPELSVETEVVRLDDKIAVFRAKVSYPRPESPDWSEVCGTGHGSETPQGFPPGYIEKAETIAIGRALAAIGYGTAAAFEEEPGSKIADAPVLQPGRPQPRDSAPAPAQEPAGQGPAPTGGINAGQMQAVTNMAVELGIPVAKRVAADFPPKDSLAALTQDEGAKLVQDLSKEVAVQRAANKQQKQLAVAGSAGADQHTR